MTLQIPFTMILPFLAFLILLWLMFSLVSKHYIAITWRFSRWPTPLSPNFSVPNQEDRGIASPLFERWVQAPLSSPKYTRLFVQNLENVDLEGHFALEIRAIGGSMKMILGTEISKGEIAAAANGSKAENIDSFWANAPASERNGLRVFAGPTYFQLHVEDGRVILAFERLPAETTWTLEWRPLQDVDLAVRIFEREAKNSLVEVRRRWMPRVDTKESRISPSEVPNSIFTLSPSWPGVTIIALVAAACVFFFVMLLTDLGHYWSMGLAGIVFGNVLWVGRYRLVRRPPPFAQGFLVPTHVSRWAQPTCASIVSARDITREFEGEAEPEKSGMRQESDAGPAVD